VISKTKSRYLILVAIIILIMSLLPLMTSCTPEGRELAIAFLEEWAAEKKIDPGTPEGLWNIGKRTLGGSTGDEDADAAIDARKVILNLVEADKLMDEGRESGDIEKMNQAIAMRPDDWTYRVSKSNLSLKQGDIDEWSEEGLKGWEIVEKENNEKTTVKYCTQNIDELEQVREDLDWKGYASNRHQYVIYNSLTTDYDVRYQWTGSEADKIKRDSYRKVADGLLGKL